MKNTLKQVFHSGKFLVGLFIISVVLLTVLIYPLFNPGDPLQMVGMGQFSKPGTYVSLYDSVNTKTYTFNLTDAGAKRVASRLADSDRLIMKRWLVDANIGIAEEDIDHDNTEEFLNLWWANFDSEKTATFGGWTKSDRNLVIRIDRNLQALLNDNDMVVGKDEDGEFVETATIKGDDYVNTKDVANRIFLPLGTDTFGRDVLKEMVAACKSSLQIGLIAGLIATFIGLSLGLLSGYLGGIVDDIIMFVTNLFTVIPSFVLLVLIAFSLGQDARGANTVAIVIGLTSWVWTTRSVRAQVTSLRNRDHVNLSKLSGHSLIRILVGDVLPYIASYVVMALILQICSGILAEAQLSMLGLGPKTTVTPTLGLMMFWSMQFTAHLHNAWWAYFPVVFLITAVSFSLNLMNTGLDQVFNPQLRD